MLTWTKITALNYNLCLPNEAEIKHEIYVIVAKYSSKIVTTHLQYGKCSKISNTFFFLFSNKMLAIMQGWNSQNAC